MALQTKVFSTQCDHGYSLELRLTENSTSTANNTSSISWSWVLVSTSYNFETYRIGWSVSLNGSVVSSQAWASASYRSMAKNSELVIASGTETIPHNNDGSKTMAVSASMTMSRDAISPVSGTSGTGTLSLSGSWALTAIPRASTLTASNGTLGTAQTLTIHRAVSTWKHTISYTCGSTSGTIVTKTTVTSRSWTPKLSLAQENITGPTVNVTLKLTTYDDNDNKVGSTTLPLSMAIPASVKPTASATVALVNDNATVAGWGVAVKGYSKYRVTTTFSNTNAQGATFKARSVKISATGETLTASPATSKLLASTSRTVTVQVQDSRSRWSDAVTVSGPAIYDYGDPWISETAAFRCDENGNADEDGTYLSCRCKGGVYSCGGHNAETVRARYRVSGGSWGGWNTLSDNVASVLNAGLSAASAYDVEFRISDTLGNSRSVTVNIPTAAVTLNLRPGGKGAAFGGYAQRDNAIDFTGWDVLGRVHSLGWCPEIESEADLNAYTTPGVYAVATNVTAATLLHVPVTLAGRLTVISAIGKRYDAGDYNYVYIRQMYETYTGQIWQRCGTATTGIDNISWQSWKLINGTDIVTEQGVSGMWTYRKYASGLAECWGRKSFENVACTNEWSGAAEYYAALSAPDNYPFSFTEKPNVQITEQVEGGVGWTLPSNNDTVNNAGSIYLCTPRSYPSVDVTVNYRVIGKWMTPGSTATYSRRIMTYNVGQWNWGKTPTGIPANQYNEKLANLRSFINRYNPDIVCMQEMSRYIDQAKTVESNSVLFSGWDYIYDPNYNNAIRSKFNLYDEAEGYLTAASEAAHRPKYLYAHFDVGGEKRIGLLNVHLHDTDTSVQVAEMRAAIALMANDDYAIICGDFNAFPNDDAKYDGETSYLELFGIATAAGFQLANGKDSQWTKTWQETSTWPGTWYCDNILVKGNITIRQVLVPQVYNDLCSDHWPVIADLIIE